MTQADIWLDGALVRWSEARTSVLSHAIQRGALVFDVGALREGAGGKSRLFRPREHIDRFLRSASLIGLDVRWSADALLAATLEVAHGSGAPRALVRWSAFVATPEVDVVPRADALTSVAIAVITPEDLLRPGEAPRNKPGALRLSLSSDVRKAGPEVFPPQAKVAASYLGPMLAKRAALSRGFDEVVLLDREGLIAEAPTANVFAVRAGVLITPPLSRVLAGITRDSVLALARAEGMAAREAHLTPAELTTADEVFLTATSYPVQPVASVDGRELSAAPGPITARIRDAIQACERGEDDRFRDWVVDLA